MKIISLAIVALALAGCIPAKHYVMQNPKTGEIAQCQNPGGSSFFVLIQQAQNNAAVEDCAEGYEAAGWKRLQKND